jgi:hypothetical protein
MFFQVVLPIRPGPGQIDSINRLIQLTVIQLSGGHCMSNVAKTKLNISIGNSLSIFSSKWGDNLPLKNVAFLFILLLTFLRFQRTLSYNGKAVYQ